MPRARILSTLVLAAGCAISAPQLWANTGAAAAIVDDDPAPADLAKLADTLKDSFVRVEWTGQYDKGEAPSSSWSAWRGGTRSGESSRQSESWEQLIRDERPLERSGMVLSPTRVLTADLLLHPRFIRSIAVRHGSQVVDAKVVAHVERQNAVILELAQPLTGAKSLSFDKAKPGPYYLVQHAPREDGWLIAVGAAPGRVSVTSTERRYISGPMEALLVDRQGTPVGASMIGELAADDSWKGSPADWPSIAAADMTKQLAALESTAGAAVPRIALTFRSPRGKGDGHSGRWSMGQDADVHAEITEWNGSGVLLDPSTVLILAALPPKVTARLEGVKVIFADGTQRTATFAGSLRDYGAFLAKLDKPAPSAPKLDADPIQSHRDTLLFKAEIAVQGETRTAYYTHERISAFEPGWRRQLMPQIAPSREGFRGYQGGPDSLNFIFDAKGELIAIPIARRQRVQQAERSWDSGATPMMTPIAYVTKAIGTGSGALDPDNAPLSEAEENRLAWLGVEMQAMDEELARINNVSDQTSGGQTGAIVSFVYPNSPASKAGIEAGDILLRLHIEGQPRPLEIQLEADRFGGMFQQFFSMLDQIPEEYLDQIPSPWGSAENIVTRSLTDVGFGTPYRIEYVRNGTLMNVELKVEQGPAHYGGAPRFKSESAGLTVRDITYEVRRFFQLKPEDPGVIISKVERGGKSAVAGLKPYEIVTSVNDTPIKTIADFENAIKPGGELRLSVKRMTEGRLVKLRLDAPAAPAGEPAKPAEPQPAPAGAKDDNKPGQ